MTSVALQWAGTPLTVALLLLTTAFGDVTCSSNPCLCRDWVVEGPTALLSNDHKNCSKLKSVTILWKDTNTPLDYDFANVQEIRDTLIIQATNGANIKQITFSSLTRVQNKVIMAALVSSSAIEDVALPQLVFADQLLLGKSEGVAHNGRLGAVNVATTSSSSLEVHGIFSIKGDASGSMVGAVNIGAVHAIGSVQIKGSIGMGNVVLNKRAFNVVLSFLVINKDFVIDWSGNGLGNVVVYNLKGIYGNVNLKAINSGIIGHVILHGANSDDFIINGAFSAVADTRGILGSVTLTKLKAFAGKHFARTAQQDGTLGPIAVNNEVAVSTASQVQNCTFHGIKDDTTCRCFPHWSGTTCETESEEPFCLDAVILQFSDRGLGLTPFMWTNIAGQQVWAQETGSNLRLNAFRQISLQPSGSDHSPGIQHHYHWVLVSLIRTSDTESWSWSSSASMVYISPARLILEKRPPTRGFRLLELSWDALLAWQSLTSFPAHMIAQLKTTERNLQSGCDSPRVVLDKTIDDDDSTTTSSPTTTTVEAPTTSTTSPHATAAVTTTTTVTSVVASTVPESNAVSTTTALPPRLTTWPPPTTTVSPSLELSSPTTSAELVQTTIPSQTPTSVAATAVFSVQFWMSADFATVIQPSLQLVTSNLTSTISQRAGLQDTAILSLVLAPGSTVADVSLDSEGARDLVTNALASCNLCTRVAGESQVLLLCPTALGASECRPKCNIDPCLRGSCTDVAGGGFVCFCPASFTGDNCEKTLSSGPKASTTSSDSYSFIAVTAGSVVGGIAALVTLMVLLLLLARARRHRKPSSMSETKPMGSDNPMYLSASGTACSNLVPTTPGSYLTPVRYIPDGSEGCYEEVATGMDELYSSASGAEAQYTLVSNFGSPVYERADGRAVGDVHYDAAVRSSGPIYEQSASADDDNPEYDLGDEGCEAVYTLAGQRQPSVKAHGETLQSATPRAHHHQYDECHHRHLGTAEYSQNEPHYDLGTSDCPMGFGEEPFYDLGTEGEISGADGRDKILDAGYVYVTSGLDLRNNHHDTGAVCAVPPTASCQALPCSAAIYNFASEGSPSLLHSVATYDLATEEDL